MNWYKLLKAWGDKPAGEKIQLSEDDAKSLLETGYVELIEDNPLDTAVKDALGKFQTGMVEVVSKTTEAIVKKLSDEAGIKKDADGNIITDVHDNREDDPSGGFRNMDEFAKCVKTACAGMARADERLLVLNGISDAEDKAAKAAYGINEAVGEEGAYMTPPEFSNRIFERVRDGDLGIPAQCDNIVLARNALQMNGMVDDDRYTAATRHAGVIAYWVAEADQITKTKLKFRPINLRLNKIAVLVYCTDEMLEDSIINMGDRIGDKAGLAIGEEVQEAIMFGSGVGRPKGAFGSNCCISVTKEGSQTADTIVLNNILKMWMYMAARSRGNAQWYYNQEAEFQLQTLNTGGTTTTSGAFAHALIYMPPGGLSASQYSSLIGRPARATDHCEALGDAGDICLGDWSQYLLATRGTIKTAMSIHLRFDYDETAYRFTFRVDGRPLWDKSLRPRKGASAFRVSPYIKVAARA